jgi:hypothetical protein
MTRILKNAIDAYLANSRLISLFSMPFIISIPLALLLPNYIALSGIFLRLGSLGSDVSLVETLVMIAVLLVSLILFSFALVAVNSVIKAQRSLNKLKHADFERMEEATFKLFAVLLIAFLATFAFNLLLYQSGIFSEAKRVLLNALFAAAVSLVVLFAPQAIVLDNASVEHAFTLSLGLTAKRPALVALFVLLSAGLIIASTVIFSLLPLSFAPLLAIAVNSLLFVPFLEVVKVQIYLSKYNLL